LRTAISPAAATTGVCYTGRFHMADDDPESFAALFESTQQPQAGARTRARALRVGDRLEGKVILVGKDAVFVEIDGKRQAFIEAVELRAPDGTLATKVGDTLAAQVVEIDERSGQVRLGRSLAATGDVASLQNAKSAGVPVEGKVTGVNKGGLEVDVAGHRAFCPLSQIDRRSVQIEPKDLIGRTLSFVVTEVKDGGRNIVLSRRIVLDREAAEAAANATSAEPEASAEGLAAKPAKKDAVPGVAITVGAIVKGKVDHVETYGVFVQIDGTRGREGRGLVPLDALGVPRGTDLRKTFPQGAPVVAKVLETGDRKLRLSITGAKDDEERAQFEEARDKVGAPKTLGTLGDLLRKHGR
jgi:small subunit ribosomal protein S1